MAEIKITEYPDHTNGDRYVGLEMADPLTSRDPKWWSGAIGHSHPVPDEPEVTRRVALLDALATMERAASEIRVLIDRPSPWVETSPNKKSRKT